MIKNKINLMKNKCHEKMNPLLHVSSPSYMLQVPVSTSEPEPPMVTCISPSIVIHISFTHASESTLDMPHDNIENVFYEFLSLSEVSATMIDDFNKLMNEPIPRSNESSLENPSHVITMTSPIVTTTI